MKSAEDKQNYDILMGTGIRPTHDYSRAQIDTDAGDKAALNRLLQNKLAGAEDDMVKQWMGAIEMANPAMPGKLYFHDPDAVLVSAQEAREHGLGTVAAAPGMIKAPRVQLRLHQAENGGWAVFNNHDYDQLLGVFHSMEALCIWLKANAK